MYFFFLNLYKGYVLGSVIRLLFFPFFGLVKKFSLSFFLLKFYVWNWLDYFSYDYRFHLFILVLILVYLTYLALIVLFFSHFGGK